MTHRRFILLAAVAFAIPAPVLAVVTVGGVNVPLDNTDANYSEISGLGTNNYILNPMINSTETFAFETVLHCGNYIKVRKQISIVMNNTSDGGSPNFDYDEGHPVYPDEPATDTDPGTNYFRSRSDKPGVLTKFFKVAPDVPASLALDAIQDRAHRTRSDCLAAVCCAILLGHQNALGRNFIDDQIPVGALQIPPINEDGTLGALYFLDDVTDEQTVIPGDYRYMSNDSRYRRAALDRRNPDGTPMFTDDTAIWNGENCICNEDDYSGLGLLEVSEDTLRTTLRENLRVQAGITLTDKEATDNITWTDHSRIKIFPP